MKALPDFSDIFARYEALRGNVDALFGSISQAHPECVKCGEGCSDCCHALFDLSLVEAMYINRKFLESFDYGPERSEILQRADEADRRTYKFKRKIFKDSQEGRDSNEILKEVALMRQKCPLLGGDNRCRMYLYRPMTCRVYGVPANIGGEAHTCGQSAFQPGAAYPTISLDALNQRLAALSQEITGLLTEEGSKFNELHQVFVPLSMALMTNYDDVYFGLKKGKTGGK